MTAIHLCIDMQKWAVPNGKFSREDWRILKTNIQSLLDGLKVRNIQTIWCGHDSGDYPFLGTLAGMQERYLGYIADGFKSDFIHSDKMIDFPLKSDDMVVMKRKASAATVPGLLDYLHAQGITTVILSGWSEGCNARSSTPWAPYEGRWAGYCISETARDLREAGFEVIIAAEATNAPLRSCYGRAEPLWAGHRPRPIVLPTLEKRREVFQAINVRVEPIVDILNELGPAAPSTTERRTARRSKNAAKIASLT